MKTELYRLAAKMGPTGWGIDRRPPKTQGKKPEKPVPENLQDNSMDQIQEPLKSTGIVSGSTPSDNLLSK